MQRIWIGSFASAQRRDVRVRFGPVREWRVFQEVVVLAGVHVVVVGNFPANAVDHYLVVLATAIAKPIGQNLEF